MTQRHPLPLFHSWPVFDAAARMDLRQLRAICDDELAPSMTDDPPTDRSIGVWRCDLADETLVWTQAVYDLFGFPADQPLIRAQTLDCYTEHSRAEMAALRTHAIRHQRGFTLDAQIRRPNGDRRWMRLSALPILQCNKVVRLCGTKQDVTDLYDGTGWRAV